VSNEGAFHKLVHGAEITIGLVPMLLVKHFFVESLIAETDVFPGLKDLLVKKAATCRSLLLWMPLAAVAVADSSAMHACGNSSSGSVEALVNRYTGRDIYAFLLVDLFDVGISGDTGIPCDILLSEC